MYCRNCRATVADNAMACTSCGFAPRSGNRFCCACGSDTAIGAILCVKCGVGLTVPPGKSRLTAGLLNLLLPMIGVAGVGRIYAGYTVLGVIQLLLGPCLCIGWIWSMIDGIVILAGSPKNDRDGTPLV